MCYANDSIAVKFLLKNGIILNQELLEWVEKNSSPTIKTLVFVHRIKENGGVLNPSDESDAPKTSSPF